MVQMVVARPLAPCSTVWGSEKGNGRPALARRFISNAHVLGCVVYNHSSITGPVIHMVHTLLAALLGGGAGTHGAEGSHHREELCLHSGR